MKRRYYHLPLCTPLAMGGLVLFILLVIWGVSKLGL